MNLTPERREQLYLLEAHEEGSDAAEVGLDQTDNPYQPQTEDWCAWQLGWQEVTIDNAEAE